MTDKTSTQPQILDMEQFLKEERQVFFAWRLMGILALIMLIGLLHLGQDERLLAQVTTIDNLSRAYSLSTAYDAAYSPPADGIHRPTWQNCGVYAYSLDPARIVHSLEHGAVWIAYQPTLPLKQVNALREMAQEQAEVVMSPYFGLSDVVVLSAWSKQLAIESFPGERVLAFIKHFQGNGPEGDAACDGGVGMPIH
jgi:hypothetical protein